MQPNEIEWIVVNKGVSNRPIGAVGFIDNRLAVIGTFYADRDADYDGKVGVGEYLGSMLFSREGHALAEVAGEAAYTPEVLMKDTDAIVELSNKTTMNYFTRMAGEAVYNVYFKRGVGALAKPLAAKMVSGAFKQFLVRKGMEAAVKRAYQANFAVG
jgi:hypothetical protein